MKTLKVSKPDGPRCLYCNARVGADAAVCPECGSEFAAPEPTPGKARPTGSRRFKPAFGRHRRSYWLMLAVLAGSLVLLLALFSPRARPPSPTLPAPAAARPDYRILATEAMPSGRLNRLTVIGLVAPGLDDRTLRDVLDWLVHDALDRYNRREKKAVRVVWTHVLEDSAAPWSAWRAMAIWTDPALPEASRPARIGGDAVREDAIEYDFTNPSRPRPQTDKGDSK